MPKLQNLIIRGVALVDRGANQHAKVLISKRAGGDMTDAEKKDADDKGAKVLADALAALKKANDELTELKAASGLTSDLDTLKKQFAESDKALKKERAELQEQVTKAQKDTEDARAEVAKIKQQRRRENFIKRAHELTGLPGAPADDFAEILDAVEAGLHQVAPEKAEKWFAKFNQLLTSWNTIVSKSAILDSIGRDGSGTFRGAAAQLDHLAKAMMEKDPKLSYAVAYDKVLGENPELYRKYQRETEKES
jgi:Alanyl-tRNA synthetase